MALRQSPEVAPLELYGARVGRERSRRSELRACMEADAAAPVVPAALAPIPPVALPLTLVVDGALDVTDRAIGLLNVAAEIEHGLMIEYLYASATLEDPDAAALVLAIASEEMGHLLTVENLLLAVGGDPCLTRQDQKPDPADPFTFQLRPATADVVAAFVAAESPAFDELPWLERPELRRILREAGKITGGTAVRRVALVYDSLRALLVGEPVFRQIGQAPNPNYGRQATRDEPWARGGFDRHLILREIGSRDAALEAVRDVASQGEGFTACVGSHFERFRRLHRGMQCSRRLARAGLVLGRSPDGRLPRWLRELGLYSMGVETKGIGVKGQPATDLFNCRYQLLLLNILDALDQARGDPDRAMLIATVMREMVLVIAPLLRWLARLERSDGTPGVFDLPAGFPPFARAERDRLQVDHMARSQLLVGRLRPGASEWFGSVLDEVERLDRGIVPPLTVPAREPP